ncbi:hypothetical protein F4824DRAFT_511609 [Ustulina deusta]|nr:hypothetical protein F4824DRAFT_511609 [Ustulina deusta]
MPRNRYRSDGLRNDVWAENETILRRLYLKEHKTLKDVKEEMEAEHGFPTTSLSTYESKLRDLGLRKKMKRKDWRPVYQHYLSSSGRHTAIFFNGARIPWDRAWKEIRRSGAREPNDSEAIGLPTDVIMRTPSPVLVPQRACTIYRGPVPWHLSDAPLDGLSLDAIFRRLTLYDIPSNLLRISMLSGLQLAPTKSRMERDRSSGNHHSWPSSTNQSIEYTLHHQSSTVSRQDSNPTSINSDIDRLSTALYRLANGEVRWSRPGEPFDELLDVVLNLTPKHILLKILEGDSPTIRVATKELVKILRGVGRKDDFRNIVEAVGRYHPEWTRQDRYLTLAAQVGCTDTCRLLLRMPHSPKYDSEYEDAVLESIARGYLECAIILCQHLIKPDTTLSREDITASIIFSDFLVAAARERYCSEVGGFPYDFSLQNACVRQMLNWLLEAGANVDGPAPVSCTSSSIYAHTPRFLVPTILDYVYFEDFELYSLLVSHSVKFRTELTRSGIHRAAREGSDSLRLYLLSRSSHTLVRQNEFLGILLTEELLRPALDRNLDFNVLCTLLDYNRSHPEFRSKLNVSAMLYHVVRASRRQGIRPSTLQIIKTLTHKGAVMVAETMAEAIEEEGTALLQLLSSSGADFKSQGALALCAAMTSGNYDAVSWLLDTGVDANATLRGHGGENDITVLARANCYMALENFYIFDYQLQLMSAPWLLPMSCAMLEFLISRNVRLRARSSDPSFRELLYLIVTHGYQHGDLEGTFKKIRVLLNAEIIPNDQSGTKPCLLEACFQDHVAGSVSPRLALMELFLDYGISARYSGVLAHMIRIGAPSDKIQRVLDGGVDVNTYSGQNTGSGGWQRTPLQEAAGVGSLDLVQLLMQRGADVNLPPKGYIGRTAVQRACEGGTVPVNVHLIKFLIANGANVNAPPAPSGGVTAFQAAAMEGNFEVALLLLDHGADINAPPAEECGYCALDGAAACGKLDMVQFLLDLGALSHDGGESGYRGAIRVAERGGQGAIADMIRQYAVKTGKSGEEVSANYPWWEEEENSGTEHDSDDSYDSSEEIEDWEI